MHEAKDHDENCFITLTYSDELLPEDLSLNKADYQKFMKRLRKWHAKHTGKPSGLRYFHCGEYGDTTSRPHYHACLFGFDFSHDRKLYKYTPAGDPLWTSDTLNDLWQLGYAIIGDLTFETAAYVARYTLKKVTGDLAPDHYRRVNTNTGEVHDLTPEYATMSRRPGGIGHRWIKKWGHEVYKNDSVIVNGREQKPPKYYDTLYETERPHDFARVRAQREAAASAAYRNSTPARLAVREQVAAARQRNVTKETI